MEEDPGDGITGLLSCFIPPTQDWPAHLPGNVSRSDALIRFQIAVGTVPCTMLCVVLET